MEKETKPDVIANYAEYQRKMLHQISYSEALFQFVKQIIINRFNFIYI